VGKLPFVRDAIQFLKAANEEKIDYERDPWGRTLEIDHP
jgi:hypothetical protein